MFSMRKLSREEDSPLTTTPRQFFIAAPSKYRWTVLAVYGLYSFLQNAVWDTWGPISGSASKALGFTPHDYDLLSNWGAIGILIAMPPFVWLMNKTGPRMPVLAGGGLLFIGTMLRCFPLQTHLLKYFIHAGQFLNSFAGCPIMAGAPLVSNIWFPSNQRVTATSCMLLVGNLGNGFSYLVGPAMVDDPANCPEVTSVGSESFVGNETMEVPEAGGLHDDKCARRLRKQIGYLMYMECAFAFAVLILLYSLFKNNPDDPPSASAREERLDILTGLKALAQNKPFWVIVAAFCLVDGAFWGWYGLITVLYLPHGITQEECGVLVFVMTSLGVVCGIAVGWFADRLKGRIKWIFFGAVCILFVVLLYLMILTMGWMSSGPLQFSKGGIFVATVMIGMLVYSIEPIATEMAADMAYPVNEGTSGAVLAWIVSLFMFLFLLTLNLTNGQHVAYYLFLAFVGLAAPIVACCTSNFNQRMEIDDSNNFVMTHERILD